MNRNENSRFSTMPSIKMRRSVVSRPFNHKLTFSAGDIIPFYIQPVLPGTSVSLKSAALVRMETSIHPSMDKAFVDTYWFFIPNRLLWDKWEQFIAGTLAASGKHGGNPTDWQVNAVGSLLLPRVLDSNGQNGLPFASVTCGSIYDYMGIPVPDSNSVVNNYYKGINALPFIAYNLVYSEWFRDENLISAPQLEPRQIITNVDYFKDTDFSLRKAGKFHDYFTSSILKPQKGSPVNIPIGTKAPITGGSPYVPVIQDPVNRGLFFDSVADDTSHTVLLNNEALTTSPLVKGNAVFSGTGGVVEDIPAGVVEFKRGLVANIGAGDFYADLTQATATTINELRLLFQTQKWLEKNAMYGSRYTEILKAHFGTTVPDYRLQRPEYLGGNRTVLNMKQITQTSETATTPMGTTAGQSVTVDKAGGFVKSFPEHGYLLGVIVVRPVHTYQYGIAKDFKRSNRLDMYWPVFANIGYQPIYNYEIYAKGTSDTTDDEVFGYQEAWADYRYTPNRVSGYFRSNVTGTLDSWHYADKYESLPMLSKDWIEETPNNINRTLAVSSDMVHQFIANIQVESKWTIPMPVNSIPGLVDHF